MEKTYSGWYCLTGLVVLLAYCCLFIANTPIDRWITGLGAIFFALLLIPTYPWGRK